MGLFLFMFIIIMSNNYNKHGKLETLLDNNSVTYARITYFGGGSGRSASPPEYTFQLKDKKIISVFYNVRFCKKVSQRNQFNFSKNKFPVIYNPTNPEINQILLKIEDYYKYNVPIPDTLAEVLVKYFNCDQYRVVRQEGKQTKIVKIK